MGGVTVFVVPLTFPAHQVAILPLKLWRPRWFDGTALVVGAGSPDLFSAFAEVDTLDSHSWTGIALAVPFTIIYSMLLRRFAVDGLFGSLPNLGPLRLKSYRVLRNGRPRLLVTMLSSFLGVMSHVIVDSFTHQYRIGANLLRLNDIMFETPLGPFSQAKFLQYLGHSFGSLIGVLLFVAVVSKRHLGDWYGMDAIADARRRPVRHGAPRRTRRVLIAALTIGIAWGLTQGSAVIFTTGLTFVLGLLVAGIVNTDRSANAPIDQRAPSMAVR